jgi:integrase
MTILDLAAAYVSATECSDRYAANLLRTARRLTGYGINTIRQLSCDTVNKILVEMRESQQTRHNCRRELLTLWRWAFMEGLVAEAPMRLRAIKVRAKPVVAWGMDKLGRLLALAGEDQTPISRRLPGITRSHLLPCWIGLAYDSGLRFTDVQQLTVHQLRNDCVAVTATKTGKVTVRRLSDETAEEVARVAKLSPDGSLFSWALPRRRAFVMWRAFLDENKIGGSSKYLRRSAATMVHKARAGMASEFLSHSDPKLVWKHYLDQTLLDMPEGPPPIRKPR